MICTKKLVQVFTRYLPCGVPNTKKDSSTLHITLRPHRHVAQAVVQRQFTYELPVPNHGLEDSITKKLPLQKQRPPLSPRHDARRVKQVMLPNVAAYPNTTSAHPHYLSIFQKYFDDIPATQENHAIMHIVRALHENPALPRNLPENTSISLLGYLSQDAHNVLASKLHLTKITDIAYLGTYPLQTISVKGINSNGVPAYKIFSYNRKHSTVTTLQDMPVPDALNSKKIMARSKQIRSLKNFRGNEQIVFSLKPDRGKKVFKKGGKKVFKKNCPAIEEVIATARESEIGGANLLVNSIRVPGACPAVRAKNTFYAMKMTGIPVDKYIAPYLQALPIVQNRRNYAKNNIVPLLQLWGRDSLAAARCIESFEYAITDQKLDNSIFVREQNGTLRSAQIDIDDLEPLDKHSLGPHSFPHRDLYVLYNSSPRDTKILMRIRNIAIGLIDKLLDRNYTPHILEMRDYFDNPSFGNPAIIQALVSEIAHVLCTYYGIQDPESINLIGNLIISPSTLLSPTADRAIFCPTYPSITHRSMHYLHKNMGRLEGILNRITRYNSYTEPVFDNKTTNVTISQLA